MRRFVALSIVLALAGCQADDRPTAPPEPRPLAAISDGAHAGTRGFYFLPPLVPTPTFAGTFNASLAPSVEICKLSPESVCVGDPVTRFAPSAIAVDITTEQYHVNWKTDDSPLDVTRNYRIRVFIGSSADGMELGFRDVHPVATPQEVPKDPEGGDLYVFTFGSNIPIKFRIEKGALCAPGATDCGEGSLDAAGGMVMATFAGVQTYEGTLPSGQFTLIVERIDCPRVDGRVVFLPMDIPQFAGCYRVRSIPAVTLVEPAVVGVCFEPNPTNLTDRQEELLALHRYDRSHPELAVEALPVVPFPLECQDFASAAANPLMNLARAGVRALQQAFSPWISPPPLLAVPPGLGGLTGSFSDFVWALPSQMAILEGDNQIAPLSTAVAIDPAVRVTDSDGNPVQGATVSFAVTQGGGTVIPAAPLQIVTGADGVAGVARVSSWTLGGTSGPNRLEASGIGLARPQYSGYLERGAVTFHATACAPGYGTATVDGRFDGDEWRCAITRDFTAKVSGGSGTPATLYWMNDNATLYLAVRLRRSSADKVNTLQFNFDNDNDAASGTGAAETGDEVLSLDSSRFTDAFLTLRCTNSSQSSCWAADAGSGGTNDGRGAFVNDGTWTTYEISHPLNTADDSHDFSLGAGSQVGLFLTLQTGSGATGNTQWPGFRRYQVITIVGP